jgi:hypothetical protein
VRERAFIEEPGAEVMCRFRDLHGVEIEWGEAT